MQRLIYITTICCLSLTVASAQTTDTIPAASVDTVGAPSKIEVDEVEVIKAFEVKLGEAKRIGLGPKPTTPTPTKNSYQYDITIVPAEISYADPVIKPLAISPDAKANVDHFYTKLGYGNTASPYGDLSFYTMTPEVYDVLIDLHHFSFDNTDKIADQKMSETNVDLKGSYLLGENTLLSLDVFGDIEGRTLYSTIQAVPPDPVTTKISRDLGRYGGKFSVGAAEPTASGLDYEGYIGGMYTYYSDDVAEAPSNTEVQLTVGGNVSQKVSEKLTSYIKGGFTLADLNAAGTDKSFSTVDANAGVRYRSGRINIDAAADLVYDAGGANIFADAELGIAIDQGMQVFVGVDQEVLQHNLSTSYDRNPFVQLDTSLLANTLVHRYYAGLRGKVLQRLTFSLTGAYEDIADQYYYTSSILSPTLSQQYQDATNIAVDANVEFAINDNVKVGGHVSQNFYDLSITEDLLNVTASEYSVYSKLALLQDRLHMTADLTILDGVPFLQNGALTTGDPMYDVSIEAQFFVLKNVALWARGSNLLDNNYIMHAGYPTVGLQAHGGVIVKF